MIAPPPTDAPVLDLQVACEAPGLPEEIDIADWLALTVASSNVLLPAASEVSIRVVDEAESRALNAQYRGHDAPTNVLSFPAELDALPGLPPEDRTLLGDIVVCAPVVEREAAQQGKDASHHWTHMLVHGVLHLLGFDHVDNDEARRMEALEVRILATGGVPNPYKGNPSS